MKYKSIFLLFLIGSLTGSYGYGQAPANDEYTGSVTLTVNPGYTADNVVSGTTVGATQSPIGGCRINAHDDDVWYKFTATKASHIVRLSNVTTASGLSNERFIEAFTNVGNAPDQQIHCSNAAASTSEGLLTGLTVGNIYFVRIYGYYTWSGVPDRINFNISILTPPDPPANDGPAGATELIINQDYTCHNAVAGTTNGATLSSTVAACNAGNDDDVWYRFTATRPSHIVRLSSISQAYGIYRSNYIEVFTSVDGQPGERILCSSNGSTDTHEGLLTGLTVNETYFVRIYAEYAFNGVADRINFNICIISPVYPPDNDEYTGAEVLTVNENNTCTNSATGTTDGATQSEQSACNTNENDDDVWYYFVATNAAHNVHLSGITLAYGNTRAYTIEVLREEEGVPGELIACESSQAQSHEVYLAGLTAGDTYFVRIYADYAFSGISNRINFNLCVLTPPVPANDECTAAVDISNGNQVSGTTSGATESRPAGSCGSGYAYDVWYKVTPASSGALTVTAYTGDFNLVLEAFTGSCESLFSIACKNDADGSESLTITDAAEGTTYYFRVYNNTPAAVRVAAETGNFTIQVSGDALPIALASFKASPSESNSVRLDWTTTEEANAGHFEVEHSLSGKEWSKIGEIKASGVHAGIKSYTYIHTNPSLSLNYYRLRSVDLDGAFTHSAIERISLSGKAKELFVYPNPASEYLSLEAIGDQRAISSMQLFNMTGNEAPLKLDKASRLLDVRHLPAGSYLLRVSRNNSSVQTFRVVIGR